MAGPIDVHPLRNDPISAGAVRTVTIGNRKLLAMADGFLLVPETFVGTHEHPTAGYDALAAQMGQVRLPLGCFLLAGEKTTLIDAGFGPVDYDGLGLMVGGRLLEHLMVQGVRPGEIDVVTLSHLHSDHIGWIADINGEPTFANATVYIGRADWEYFVEGGAEPAPGPHILHALELLNDRGQIELVDGEAQIVAGLTRMPAPGHTPGHSIYVIHDSGERVLLLGDAIYCPQQLTNTDWAAAWDVDPILAARTRERYARDLELHGGEALGCHFPELTSARLLVSPEALDY